MPKLLNWLRRTSRRFPALVLLFFSACAAGADWSQPAQQLARKISNKTGPGAVAISFKNASGLGAGDMSDARRALEQSLRAAGLRFVPAEQAAAQVSITFSENAEGYLWVAQMRAAAGEDSVAMVTAPRASAQVVARPNASVVVRKQLLWVQQEPILDVAALGDSHLAVLAPERVLLLKKNGMRWEREQELGIEHARPWPRDVRGRLAPRREHLFDAFLPGVLCSSSAKLPLTLLCRASDEPWPLTVGDQPPQYAFYGAQRNFFNGGIRPGFGETRGVAPFFSAAGLPRGNYTLWLFTGVDGNLRVTDGAGERVIGPRGWGSDVAAVMNGCVGPQALITSAGDSRVADTVVALDVPEREPMAASLPLEFSGPVTALWSATDGASAVAVSKNLKTGQYEAYSLTLACQ